MENLVKIGKLKLWQQYNKLQQKQRPLSLLFWECSLRCNLSCRHCGSSCGPEQATADELSTAEIKKVFFDIARDFNPKQVMIALTGGEALLRKDIFEVMKYAKGLGFSWGMVTNGMLITPEIVGRLKDAGMSTVSVSLDGLESNHNWLRCDKTSFKKAAEGIKLLADSGAFDFVEAITCVNQLNLGELDEIYQTCKDLGADGWRLFTITPTGRAKNNPELFLDGRQFRYLLDYIKAKRKGGKKEIKVEFCDEGYLGPEYEGEVRNRLFYCGAGLNVASILYNGDIAACPIIAREHTRQGNIRQDRFSEIWKNKFAIFRQKDWRKRGDCKDCIWWEFCEGGSMHLEDFNSDKLMFCSYNLISKGKDKQKRDE